MAAKGSAGDERKETSIILKVIILQIIIKMKMTLCYKFTILLFDTIFYIKI